MTQPYQEEGSTFQDGDRIYDLNKIWKAVNHRPILYIAVDQLDWVVQPKDTPDQERVDRSDLTAPLLITRSNGRMLVVDGYHRLVKALKNQVLALPYRFVPSSVMRSALVNPQDAPSFTKW